MSTREENIVRRALEKFVSDNHHGEMVAMDSPQFYQNDEARIARQLINRLCSGGAISRKRK